VGSIKECAEELDIRLIFIAPDPARSYGRMIALSSVQ
jgi:hypothetical protein